MSLVRNFVVKKPFSDHTKIDKPSAINRFKRALNVCRGLHTMNTEHTCHESTGRMQLQRRMSPVSLRKQQTFRDATQHWFPHEMTSEERVQKFHTDDV